jgi:cell division protein FtsW
MAYVRWASPYKFLLKQILWISIGFILMFITGFLIDYQIYKKYSKIIYFISLILVVVVLFVGDLRLGAKRWLNIGFLNLQPSELAKFSIIVMLSDFISRKKNLIKDWGGLIAPLTIVFLIILPIALEPDLGTPILMTIVSFAMLFCAGVRIRVIFSVAIMTVLLATEEVIRKPYRLLRFKDYLSSFVNIDASSYQIKQSLNALGAGGFFGKGLGRSEIKLMYLPEAHTDFIFPIIGEELGFIGAVMVIIFFIYFFLTGIKMSKYMPDTFSQYLCLGITFLIVFQAIINLSVATGVFPAKGLSLPFISFGGTSLVITMAITGILINLSQYDKSNI